MKNPSAPILVMKTRNNNINRISLQGGTKVEKEDLCCGRGWIYVQTV
jgi:hypothetical protein